MDAEMSRKTWELENNIKTVPPCDEIFRFDAEQQRQILDAKPWARDPRFFTNIKISALSLLKMVTHARSGGALEIMGLLIGKVEENTMIVMDAFALPVEGTETLVNAQSQAYEYMAAYMESAKEVGRLENAIGWYHSHPGYGCWLSGIDVSTQMLNQTFQDPFVAIVVDPIRTVTAGKVCLGAFRTYPKDYIPPNEGSSEDQPVPFDKIEDFGMHSKKYYPLEVSYFKSELDRTLLDSMWHKYWVNTLSSSGLLTNADHTTRQIFDLAEKLKQSESRLHCGSREPGSAAKEEDPEEKLAKVARESSRFSIDLIHGLMAQIAKDKLFNKVGPTGN